MKLSFFETLDAVLRSGSMAGAARLMNLTPSAVSMQMKLLEQYFGQPLLDRAGRRVRAKPIAIEIAGLMREPMQRVQAMRHRSSVQVEGLVRFGVVESLQTSMLPATTLYLRDHFPALILRAIRGRTVELIDSVKAGLLDAALVVQPPAGGSQRLNWYPVMKKELVLITPPQVEDTKVAALFRTYGWIRFDPSTHTGRAASRWVATHAHEAHVLMDLQSVLAVVSMVSAGLGIALVPWPDEELLKAYPVRAIPLGRAAPSISIALICRRTDTESRPIHALREAINAARMAVVT